MFDSIAGAAAVVEREILLRPDRISVTVMLMDAFDQLITAFGGRRVVSEITGASPNAVTQWRGSGVPFRHWFTLVEAAQERGLRGVDKSLLEATRPKSQEAA